MKYVSTFIISVFIIAISCSNSEQQAEEVKLNDYMDTVSYSVGAVSYTHLRAHET